MNKTVCNILQCAIGSIAFLPRIDKYVASRVLVLRVSVCHPPPPRGPCALRVFGVENHPSAGPGFGRGRANSADEEGG